MRVLSIGPGATPGEVYLSFSYDPELVGLVKMVPGRAWDKARRVWKAPATPETIDFLTARVPRDTDLRIHPSVARDVSATRGALASAQAARERGDGALSFDYRTPPYAHQRAGLEFLAHIGSGALFWEMGLGKTKTAIDYAEWLCRGEWRGPLNTPPPGGALLYRGVLNDPATFRALVIAPNTVKRNWGAEIEKHAGHTDYVVLDGTIPQRIKALGSRRYSIVNCEALSIATFAKAAQAIEWDLLVVDESTRFKTPSAARTKAVHKLRAKHKVILTGTPITGKPEDAWAQMQIVAPGLLGTWWGFVDRYLVKNQWTKAIEGIRPGMEHDLSARIASRSYRIRKDEVLDLPPKVYEERVVELDGVQKAAYQQMKDELRVALADAPDIAAFNVLTQLLRLTQITAGMIGEGDRYRWLGSGENAKLAALDELVNEDLPGEQIVIFGLYQRELEELAYRYTPNALHAGIIYGPTPERRRAEIIDDFQQGRRRLLFVQQHTGGIGINLTAARYAVYFSRGWSLEDWLQSQDRLHRIGQTGTVTIVSLTAKGTVDERIAKALGQKQNLADALTGDAARALAREVLGD